MFDRKNGGRNGVKKIIVLITWSNPADVSIISKAQTVAKSMRDEGMAIIVIGVGDLDAKRLMALSGKQNWYQTDNFKSLFSKKFIDDVTQGIFDQIGKDFFEFSAILSPCLLVIICRLRQINRRVEIATSY